MSNEYTIYNQPSLIQESAKGYTHVRLEDQLFRSRKIFLNDVINTETATSVIKQLMVLDESDDEAPISLYLCTNGGSVDAGLSIIDTINSIKADVNTVSIGLVASMGAVLFSCGKTRFMYPSSKLLIHDPLVTEAGGSTQKIKQLSDSMLDYRNKIGNLLAQNCGKSLDEILKLMSLETYFTAEEALKFNIADKIITKGI
jgi:ATP-dependent Clp protease protease subunit